MSGSTWPSPPPTRIISWTGLVQEADPDFYRRLLQPIIYEFSNGRCFVNPVPYYQDYDIVLEQLRDPYGNLMFDPFGNPIYTLGP